MGKSAQKNPPGKSPAKSSRTYTTKIPDNFLQRGWAKRFFDVIALQVMIALARRLERPDLVEVATLLQKTRDRLSHWNCAAPLSSRLHFLACSSGTKKEPKPKLLSPDIFRWGRGLPHEGVGAKKFGMPLENREIKLFLAGYPGIWPGYPGGRPKSLTLSSSSQIRKEISRKSGRR